MRQPYQEPLLQGTRRILTDWARATKAQYYGLRQSNPRLPTHHQSHAYVQLKNVNCYEIGTPSFGELP